MKRQGRLRFVGRASELEELREVLSSAASGRGAAILIVGDAGIGKSRLIDEALAASPIFVRRAAARELEQGRPLGVLLDALKIAADPNNGEASQGLFVLADELLDRIERIALDAPTTLILDDLHWADELSCAVIDRLLQTLWELPLALVCSFRPEPTHRPLEIVRDTASRSSVREIALGPLDESAQEILVSEIIGGIPGPRLTRTLEGASGSPFFLETFLTSLLDEKSLISDAGVIETEQEVPPAGFRMAILRRFSSLPEACLSVLRTGAALGSSFALEELAHTTSTRAAELPSILRPAIGSGLLEEDGDRLSFSHDLMRDALYFDSPAAIRIALHRRLVDVLAEANAPLTAIAEQAYRGGRPGDAPAIEWLRKAGSALGSGAPEAATRYLDKALELSTSPGEKAEIRTELAKPLTWAARLQEAEAHLGEAIPLLFDTGKKSEAMTDLGHVLYLRDRYGEGFSMMKQAALAPGLDPDRQARLLSLTVATANEYSSEVQDLAERALELARSVRDDISLAMALIGLSKLARGRANLQSSYALGQEALAAAKRSGDEVTQLQVMNKLFAPLAHLEMFEEAHRVLEEAAQLAERTGSRWLLSQLIGGHGVTNYFSGDWDDAERDLEVALEASIAVPAEQPVLAAHLATLAGRRGDMRRARELLARYQPAEVVEDVEPQFRFAAAWVAWLGERYDEVAEHAEVVIDTYEKAWGLMALWTGSELIPMLVEAGHEQAARRYLVRVEEVAGQVESHLAKIAALRCRAVVNRDAALAVEAVELAGSGLRRPLLADTCVDAGRLLLAAGDRVAAESYLRRAADIYRQIGATPHLNHTSALLRSMGVAIGARGTRQKATSGWESLTRSEASVARLVSDGLTNREVAGRLFVSKKTVETHLGRVYQKLGVRSRVELTRLAVEAPPANKIGQDPE